jgi:hypothetical protein
MAATTVCAGAGRGGAFVSAAVPKKVPRKKYPPPMTTTRRTKNRRRFIDIPRWSQPGRHVDDLIPNLLAQLAQLGVAFCVSTRSGASRINGLGSAHG